MLLGNMLEVFNNLVRQSSSSPKPFEVRRLQHKIRDLSGVVYKSSNPEMFLLSFKRFGSELVVKAKTEDVLHYEVIRKERNGQKTVRVMIPSDSQISIIRKRLHDDVVQEVPFAGIPLHVYNANHNPLDAISLYHGQPYQSEIPFAIRTPHVAPNWKAVQRRVNRYRKRRRHFYNSRIGRI